jgi:hypothetical protein
MKERFELESTNPCATVSSAPSVFDYFALCASAAPWLKEKAPPRHREHRGDDMIYKRNKLLKYRYPDKALK